MYSSSYNWLFTRKLFSDWSTIPFSKENPLVFWKISKKSYSNTYKPKISLNTKTSFNLGFLRKKSLRYNIWYIAVAIWFLLSFFIYFVVKRIRHFRGIFFVKRLYFLVCLENKGLAMGRIHASLNPLKTPNYFCIYFGTSLEFGQGGWGKGSSIKYNIYLLFPNFFRVRYLFFTVH